MTYVVAYGATYLAALALALARMLRGGVALELISYARSLLRLSSYLADRIERRRRRPRLVVLAAALVSLGASDLVVGGPVDLGVFHDRPLLGLVGSDRVLYRWGEPNRPHVFGRGFGVPWEDER